MNTLPDRSVTHVGKLYCHLCTEVQQLIPGMNVEANSSHHQSHLHGISGIGLGIGAIAKFKAHKDNPQQIHTLHYTEE